MDIKGYKIQDQIGQGGMAIVYRAVQESLGRPVALKVMNPLYAENPHFTSRFLDEGRLLASLRHNNIMTIYDIGVCDNLHYISMEYVDGGDLKQRIREGIVPLTALDYVITIGSCLQVAHAAKIVHRDVKPVNILFRSDDTLLLTDFGIAKQLVGRKDLTAVGSLVGSPYYLSPEQALGGDIDGRADIYSLGILLYEMLIGKRPFDGDSQIDVALKHIEGNLPPLPPTLSHFQPLVDKMTAKQVHDRFRDAANMIQAAQELRDSHQWDSNGKAVAAHQTYPGFDDTTVLYVGDEYDALNRHHDQYASTDPSNIQKERRNNKQLPNPGPQADPGPERKIFGSVKIGGIAAGLWGLALFTILLTVGLPDLPDKAIKTDESPVTIPQFKAAVKTEESPSKPVEHTLVEYPKAADLLQHNATQPHEQAALLDDGHNEIEELLNKAQVALSEYRLTSPAGNNAYDYYQQILLADPENRQANKGFSHIADRYLKLARKALQQENTQKAEQYVERGLQVKNNHSGLLAFRIDLVNQQIQVVETASQQNPDDSLIHPYEPTNQGTTSDKPKDSFFQRLKQKMKSYENNAGQDSESESSVDGEG